MEVFLFAIYSIWKFEDVGMKNEKWKVKNEKWKMRVPNVVGKKCEVELCPDFTLGRSPQSIWGKNELGVVSYELWVFSYEFGNKKHCVPCE